ncbi:MAG: transcriptional regulator [Planctomycetes bacterium]|nr:transcriptional regulator [Planctomycetota bacterium]
MHPMATCPDPVLATIGDRVRSLRAVRGLTRRELASMSGLSERFLAQVESGLGNIAVTRLTRLAAALGCRPGALLDPAPAADGRRAVSLLGLRGAGKSALGQGVADALGLAFHEHDRVVEEAAGMELGELFALHGDRYYRDVARETLDRLLADLQVPTIIATGGGVVADPEAFDLLRRRTHCVWLKATVDDHWVRVVAQGDGRPMRDRPDARAELGRLLDRRVPLYARAEHVIDTSDLGLRQSQIALRELVSSLLGIHPSPPA